MKAKINFVIFLYFFVILISVLFVANPYLFPDNVLQTIPESKNVQCDATVYTPIIFDPVRPISIRIQKHVGLSDVFSTDCSFDIIPLNRHFFNIDNPRATSGSYVYEETFGVAWEWIASEFSMSPRWMEIALFEIRTTDGPAGTVGIPSSFPYSGTVYRTTLVLMGALSSLLFLRLLPYNLREILKEIIG